MRRNDMEEFLEIVQAQRRQYPLMEPQDYGKLAYQSEFGPEHLVSADDASGLARLREEWEAVSSPAEPAVESIGNGLCRFHLSADNLPQDAASLLQTLFAKTAAEHTGTTDGLKRRLQVLADLHLPRMETWLRSYERQGYQAVHHSAAFRDAYHPHYRVIRGAYGCYFPALLAAWRLLHSGSPAILAIDGRCGSGKTGLAALIGSVLPCNVFHLDDYYLPPAQRQSGWETIPCANMDFSRFRREVLLPVRQGQAVDYRPYSCREGRYLPSQRVEPQPLTIVEGSYSHHPALADCYDETVFLTCTPAEQARRLQAREGDRYPVFVSRWIPLEEGYFAANHLPHTGALLIDTSGFPR
jgi:hypothetical protein